MAPKILIVSIAMGADYSFDVKNIDIWAPAFFNNKNSFIVTVAPCSTLLGVAVYIYMSENSILLSILQNQMQSRKSQLK